MHSNLNHEAGGKEKMEKRASSGHELQTWAAVLAVPQCPD